MIWKLKPVIFRQWSNILDCTHMYCLTTSKFNTNTSAWLIRCMACIMIMNQLCQLYFNWKRYYDPYYIPILNSLAPTVPKFRITCILPWLYNYEIRSNVCMTIDPTVRQRNVYICLVNILDMDCMIARQTHDTHWRALCVKMYHIHDITYYY